MKTQEELKESLGEWSERLSAYIRSDGFQTKNDFHRKRILFIKEHIIELGWNLRDEGIAEEMEEAYQKEKEEIALKIARQPT